MVQAALCDLDEQARALLERAHDWLEVAIRDRELPSGVYTKYWSEAQRLHAFGLCRWLKDRTIDRPLFAAACDEIIRFLRKEKDTKTTIAYNLASFILAGRFEEALDCFRSCAKLKPPSKTSGIQCPGGSATSSRCTSRPAIPIGLPWNAHSTVSSRSRSRSA